MVSHSGACINPQIHNAIQPIRTMRTWELLLLLAFLQDLFMLPTANRAIFYSSKCVFGEEKWIWWFCFFTNFKQNNFIFRWGFSFRNANDCYLSSVLYSNNLLLGVTQLDNWELGVETTYCFGKHDVGKMPIYRLWRFFSLLNKKLWYLKFMLWKQLFLLRMSLKFLHNHV